jgi:HSP20 family molecular chaperone IbpA
MWFNWNDFERPFHAFGTTRGYRDLGALGDLLRQLDRGTRSAGLYGPSAAEDAFATVIDAGDAFVFRVDVPGVREEDLRVDVQEQTLTLAARRELKKREGYSAQRTERGAFEWRRSFTLPAKIDTERTVANVVDGVLELRLAKAPGQQPRRIQIAPAK